MTKNIQPFKERALIEYWLWEKPMLMAFMTVTVLVPVLTAMFLIYFQGIVGLHALWFALFAPFFGLIYGGISKKLNQLQNGLIEEDGHCVPALTLKGKIEAAGFVVLRDDELLLVPVVGERTRLTRKEINGFKESKVFNGSFLWGKTGFWLDVPDKGRVGFAIPRSLNGRFRNWLENDV